MPSLLISKFRDCFSKYVATKALKRMEANKLRGNFKETPKTLLLPVSLGFSSVSLLHVLNQQLVSQRERSGKGLYKLHILFVDQPTPSGNAQRREAFHLLKQRYPAHMYSLASLEDMFDYDIVVEHGLLKLNGGSAGLSKQDRLQQVLSSLPSATSRADVESILRLRFIVAFAKHNRCDSIVWGDSTTRLAERTLSESAKGRGGSLPWLTADGISPYGIKFSYPMRDLLRKELTAFAAMTAPPLIDLILTTESSTQVSASSKDVTIDDLMSQYFASVEENYPSIVANVVRTSGRLAAPEIGSDDPSCCLCGLPVMRMFQQWRGNQENEAEQPITEVQMAEQERPFCYGCARSVLDSKGLSSNA